MSILKWVRRVAISAIDPDRDHRVQQLVHVIVNGLNQQKQNFSLENIQLGDQFAQADLRDAADIVFKRTLEQCWEDNTISEKENAKIKFAKKKLEIDSDQATRLTEEYAKEAFTVVLAHALEDGIIDPKEQSHLQNISAQVGYRSKDYARHFFKNESEDFLRAFFLASVEDGKLTELEWSNLLTTARSLGIPKDEFQELIQRQGQAFVEHVLVDAKADLKISPVEEKRLTWLVQILDLPESSRTYVQSEIDKVRVKEKLEDGILPVLEPPCDLETLAEEMVHLYEPCTLKITRELRDGPNTTLHDGMLAVTDRRVVFTSLTKSYRFRYSSILGHDGNELGIIMHVSNKPTLVFLLDQPNELAYPIFDTCAALANQTKVAKKQKRSRHIPRSVRQLVWQRYGGRCAECEANDYLEFDHIIPHAKGGSNSESNVQLLCRRCNLKKSDNL